MNRITLTQKFFDFYSIIDLYLRAGGFRDIGYERYPVFVSHRIEERIRHTYEFVVDSFYGRVRNALITSIRSELRHFPNSCAKVCEPELGYAGVAHKKIPTIKLSPQKYPEQAYLLFSIPKWYSAYGGPKWAEAARLLVECKKVKSRMDKIYWVDRVLDLYHNTGHLLDKTGFYEISCIREYNALDKIGRKRKVNALTFRANAKSILEFIPFNSSEIRKLVIPRKNILTPIDDSDKISTQ